MARQIIVDDTDSNVHYTGDWSLTDGYNYAKQGNFGAPYRSSLHRTTSGEASFSYTYEGSAGKIYGTIDVKTTDGVTDPTWECKVDNIVISVETPFKYTENNWPLCKWDESTIPAGKHTVTVSAKSSGRAFLFDFFLYLPSPGASVQNAEIFIPMDSSDIYYGSGWKNLGTDARMAPDGGAVLTFAFYGTGLIWVGTIPKELPSGSASAEYSIDGQSTTTFPLVGNPGSSTQYFQKYFQVSGLTLGSHTLEVTSRGKTSLTPLVLSNLIVQGGSLQEPTAGSNPGTGSSGNADNTSGKSGDKASTTDAGSTTAANSTTVPSGAKSSATSVSSSGSATTAVAVTDSSGSTIGSTAPSGTNLAGKTVESDTGTLDPTSNSGNNSIGPIIGGVVGGILVILLILAFLVYRLRRSRRTATVLQLEHRDQKEFGYTEQAQPFYTDATSSPTHVGAQSEATTEGSYGQHQMAQGGNSHPYASVSKRTQMLSTSNPFSPSLFGQGPYLSNRPISPTASGPSIAGSTDRLLPQSSGTNSKYQEAFGNELPQDGPSRNRVVTHEDSGYRMPHNESPPSPPPTETTEYPPMYTPS